MVLDVQSLCVFPMYEEKGGVVMDTESMTYVARCAYNGVVMMTVDDLDRKKEVASAVGSCLRAGYKIERITTEQARQQEFCKHHGKCKPGEVLAEQGRLL